MEPSDIIIDPEFQALIPRLMEEERKGLTASLIADGCINPLVVWYKQNILLDGHNRFELCSTHEIEYEIHEIVLDSREEAKAWVIRNQLGRRNLNESQRAMLAADLEKIYAEQAKHRQGARTDLNIVANLPQCSKAREDAAAEMNVSPRLVQAAKKVKTSGTTGLQEAVQRGKASVSAAAEVAAFPPDQQDEAVAGGGEGIVKAAKKVRKTRKAKKLRISPNAMKPVRGPKPQFAMTALDIPHDPKWAARALMSAFDRTYIQELILELTNRLKGDSE